MLENILTYLSSETAKNVLGWWTVLDIVSGYIQKSALDVGKINRIYPTGIFTGGAAFVRWVEEREYNKSNERAIRDFVSKL